MVGLKQKLLVYSTSCPTFQLGSQRRKAWNIRGSTLIGKRGAVGYGRQCCKNVHSDKAFGGVVFSSFERSFLARSLDSS